MTAEELQWNVSGTNSRKNSGKMLQCLVLRTCSDFSRQIQPMITAGHAETAVITLPHQQRITYMLLHSFPHSFFSSSWCGFLLHINSPCPQQLAQWDSAWLGSFSSDSTLNTDRIWRGKDLRRTKKSQPNTSMDTTRIKCRSPARPGELCYLGRHLGFLLMEWGLLMELHFCT